MMCRLPDSSIVLVGRIHPDSSITVSEAGCVSYSKKYCITTWSPAQNGSVLLTARARGKHKEDFTLFDTKASYFILLFFLAMHDPRVLVFLNRFTRPVSFYLLYDSRCILGKAVLLQSYDYNYIIISTKGIYLRITEKD